MDANEKDWAGTSGWSWVISPDIPSKTIASLHTVGQGCRVPLQNIEVLHLFRWYTHTHTHAPQQGGKWDDDENDMKVKMEWKLPNHAGREEGNAREEGKSKHQHDTPSPKRAKPRKGKEKRKAKADGHGTRRAEEGEDGSAWTNLTKRNLSLPRHAQDPTYLKGGERRNTWERGPMGD